MIWFGRGDSIGGIPGQVAGFDWSDRAGQVDQGMIPGRSGCGGMGEDPWLHLAPVNPLNGVFFVFFIMSDSSVFRREFETA